MSEPAPRPVRVHPLAAAAIGAALAAAALALFGAFAAEVLLAGSRLNEARNAPGAEFTRASEAAHTAVEVAAYALPFALGVGAMVAGGMAMRAVERGEGKVTGSLAGVFAIMIGGLSAVVSGCMLVAVYGWKHVPALYPA